MDDAGAFRLLKEAADALRETARIQREILKGQQQLGFLGDVPRSPDAANHHRPSHRGPSNPQHQNWRMFVIDLQRLEARAKLEGLKLTRFNVCRFGTDSARTILRTMVWYGLARDDWPPSTWDPDEPREGGKN